MLISHQLMQC